MAVADVDKQGADKEFVFSLGEFSESDGLVSDAGVHVFTINLDSSLTPTVVVSIFEDQQQEDDPFDFDISENCVSTAQNFQDAFTSPLVSEFLANDIGFETVFGFRTDDDEYRMDMYAADGDFIDDFPKNKQEAEKKLAFLRNRYEKILNLEENKSMDEKEVAELILKSSKNENNDDLKIGGIKY